MIYFDGILASIAVVKNSTSMVFQERIDQVNNINRIIFLDFVIIGFVGKGQAPSIPCFFKLVS